MEEKSWVVAIDGERLDKKHSAEDVKSVVAEHPLKQVMVWRTGMSDWALAQDIPELADQIGTGSPAAQGDAGGQNPSSAGESADWKANRKMGMLRALNLVGSVKFDRFITTEVVSAVYFLAIVVAGIAILVEIAAGFISLAAGLHYQNGAGVLLGVVQMTAMPIATYLALAFFRLVLETMVIQFKIREDTENILTALIEKN